MSVKKQTGELLDTTTPTPSGKQMIFDKTYPREVSDRYRDGNMNEVKRHEKRIT